MDNFEHISWGPRVVFKFYNTILLHNLLCSAKKITFSLLLVLSFFVKNKSISPQKYSIISFS